MAALPFMVYRYDRSASARPLGTARATLDLHKLTDVLKLESAWFALLVLPQNDFTQIF
jgi:hypothetical protein